MAGGFLKPLLALPTLSKTCFIPRPKPRLSRGGRVKVCLCTPAQSSGKCGPQPGRGHFVCQLLFYGCRGVCRAGPARWVGSNHGLKIVYGCLPWERYAQDHFSRKSFARGVCSALCSVGFKTGAGSKKAEEVGGWSHLPCSKNHFTIAAVQICTPSSLVAQIWT